MQPSRIGPYLIERKIGAGGMGTVYYARHAESGQEVAVKVLSASLAREEGLIARFDREITALKNLSNPHVVELYDSGIDDGTYYYAMEYVDGETVSQWLMREKRIDWLTVINLSVQVCSALKSAHDAGIIHRDLKPSNLLVSKDGQIKLADFGIAQIFAGRKLTMTGGVVGTVEFMSPEQAQGQRATKKSDLYSLGAVLYTMLCGRPPFTGRTAVEILQKHRFNQFDRPRTIVPEIPLWLDEVVCQLLEKEPDKRYPDAYVLSLRLQEIPKKVELARIEQTLTLDPEFRANATTIAASAQFQAAQDGGTLMRDLLRSEIDQKHRPSPVGRLLDNTWFLITVLVLVIAGGVYWMRPKTLSSEERFSMGEKLMQEPAGAHWITARDNYFLPLSEADPKTWDARLEDYLDQIEQYEFEKRLAPGKLLRNRQSPRNDIERFLRLAQHYHDIGDIGRAMTILSSLDAMVAGDPQYSQHQQQIKKQIAELETPPNKTTDSYQLLKSAMTRADQLSQAGEHDRAQQIWNGVIALYDTDPQAAGEVRRAVSLHAKSPKPKQPPEVP